tara:strand:- start:58 stop:1020 length:963 start_codon:yes stop_codon:yes gene_type:complete
MVWSRLPTLKRRLLPKAAIEASNSCNLRCRSCVAWTDKGKDFMTMETLEATLPLLHAVGVKTAQTYWRGEACVHPKLPDLTERLAADGIGAITSTNGVTRFCGDRDYMTRLLRSSIMYAVAVDGWEDELSRYRVGARWAWMMECLKLAASIDSPGCRKRVKVLMFKYNEKHRKDFIGLAEDLGFEIHFRWPTIDGQLVISEAQADEWLADTVVYQRYDRVPSAEIPPFEWRGNRVVPSEMGEYVYVHRQAPTCVKGSIRIDATGEVPPCGQFTDMEMTLGNVHTHSPEEILENYAALEARMYDRGLPECSTRCLCNHRRR